MNFYDAEPHQGVGRDRIYMSWTEQWDLPRYAAQYLDTRKKVSATPAEVLARIAQFPGPAPFRKVDMDFYLDSHFARG